jgi:CO dehydrogenase maturation factor
MLIVSDTSRRGIQAALRINELAKNLNIGVGKSYLIINQAKETPPEAVQNMIAAAGLELAGTIPEDETVYEFDLEGRPTIEMPPDSPAAAEAFRIFEKIIG